MNILDLDKQLKIERLPLYTITGDDYFYRKMAEKKFIDLIDGYAIDFNINYFGSDAVISDVIFTLNTPPLMGDYRLVLWYGDIKKINVELSKIFASELKKYLENPMPNCILVLIDEIDYFKGCYKLGEIIDCKRLDTSTLMNYVNKLIVDHGYQVDNSSLKELIVRCGNDMASIVTELEKLYAYTFESKIIDTNALTHCLTHNVELDVFKLTDALGHGDNSMAWGVLNDLLSRGEAPLMLLALITSQYRRMFMTKLSKLSDDALGKQLGIHPYAIKLARVSANSYKPMELKKIVDELQNIEYQCKQGRLGIDDGLQLGMCKVIKKDN